MISISNLAGQEVNSALTRQLSHLNEILRALKADDEVSKREGNGYLAEISNNLRKLQNLVDENSDT